jgi:hypothetical protein
VQFVSDKQQVGPGLGQALAELALVDEPAVVVPVVVMVVVVVPPSASVDVTTVVPVVVVTDPVDVAPELLLLVLAVLPLPVAASGTSVSAGVLPPQPCASTSAHPSAPGANKSHNACVFVFIHPRRRYASPSGERG